MKPKKRPTRSIEFFEKGERVHYHPIIGEPHDGKVWEISSLGFLGDDRPVAWLTGKSGCVSLAALERAS